MWGDLLRGDTPRPAGRGSHPRVQAIPTFVRVCPLPCLDHLLPTSPSQFLLILVQGSQPWLNLQITGETLAVPRTHLRQKEPEALGDSGMARFPKPSGESEELPVLRDACPGSFRSGQAGFGSHPLCLLRSLGDIFTSHTHHMLVFCLLVRLDLPPQTVNT